MKVLAIPDIHLKPWILDKADRILLKHACEKIVFLGDFVDDWGQENNIGLYNATFDSLIKFLKEHDCLICWGNHDMSYIWNKRETGFSYMALQTVRERISEVEKLMNGSYFSDKMAYEKAAYIHRIDNIIFSHGGLMQSFVEEWKSEIAEMSNKPENDISIDDILKTVNRMGAMALWEDNSPLWARPNWAYMDDIYIPMNEKEQPMFQIIGHTPVKCPMSYNGYVICDTFSTDNKRQPIGSREFIIADTETMMFTPVSVN